AGEAIRDERRWDRVTGALRRALRGELSIEEQFAARPRGLPALAGPVRVTLDNSLSDTHTVVEVKAPDRVGLLYGITRAPAGQGPTGARAKSATERAQAYDAFYVTAAPRRRIEAPARLAAIRDAIARALEPPPGAAEPPELAAPAADPKAPAPRGPQAGPAAAEP